MGELMNNGNADIKTSQTKMMVSRQAQEVQAAMIVAKKFPRDEYAAMEKIKRTCQRATHWQNRQFILTRAAGGVVSGPSIRLAEALAKNWGNMDYGIIELEQRDGKSEMMAYASGIGNKYTCYEDIYGGAPGVIRKKALIS